MSGGSGEEWNLALGNLPWNGTAIKKCHLSQHTERTFLCFLPCQGELLSVDNLSGDAVRLRILTAHLLHLPAHSAMRARPFPVTTVLDQVRCSPLDTCSSRTLFLSVFSGVSLSVCLSYFPWCFSRFWRRRSWLLLFQQHSTLYPHHTLTPPAFIQTLSHLQLLHQRPSLGWPKRSTHKMKVTAGYDAASWLPVSMRSCQSQLTFIFSKLQKHLVHGTGAFSLGLGLQTLA